MLCKLRPALRALSLASLVGVSLLTGACSWSRFDDLKDNSPVLQVKAPGAAFGFGDVMTVVHSQGTPHLVVGGEPFTNASPAVYAISSDHPSTDPIDRASCGSTCITSTSVMGLPTITTAQGAHQSCFVFAAGEGASGKGLLGHCLDGADIVLPVPRCPRAAQPSDEPADPCAPADVPCSGQGQSARDVIDLALRDRVADGFLTYGISHDAQPLMAATAQSVRQAWFYLPGQSQCRLLSPPPPTEASPDHDFGASVAVASLASGTKLIAIGAPQLGQPTANGHVWLYRLDPGQMDATPWGCLSELRPGFGVYLHTGQLLGSPSEELLISDGSSLSVYDAEALASRPQPTLCDAPPLQDNHAFLTSVECLTSGAVQGCDAAGLEFGHSVTMADVDGDGTVELVVGVSNLSIGDRTGAGAMLVYRVDPTSSEHRLLEIRYVASSQAADSLGTSVSALRLGGRDVLAAGAPGAASVYLFYCSTLGGLGSDSSRCY